MSLRLRGILAPVVAAVCAAAAPAATAGGPLTGAWSGVLSGSGAHSNRIVIVVNARETAGSWKISATCHGPLALQSISSGYHHYIRKLAPGATCAGGDVDCLKRVGASVYDTVTPRPGARAVSGTLRPAPR